MNDPAPVLVGELFPADDVIARWVFQLTVVFQDLATPNSQLVAALKDGKRSGASHFNYRQLIVRLYEAERCVHAMDGHAKVRAWVTGLPGVAEPVDLLRDAYLPPGTSKVRKLYADLRHTSVHHVKVGSPELHKVLTAAAQEEAWMVQDHDEHRAWFEWPEVVMARAHAGNLDDPAARAALTERIELAQSLGNAFGQLSMIALRHHADRLGIDRHRMLRHVGTPRTDE